jgi:hypothetical protein
LKTSDAKSVGFLSFPTKFHKTAHHLLIKWRLA